MVLLSDDRSPKGLWVQMFPSILTRTKNRLKIAPDLLTCPSKQTENNTNASRLHTFTSVVNKGLDPKSQGQELDLEGQSHKAKDLTLNGKAKAMAKNLTLKAKTKAKD